MLKNQIHKTGKTKIYINNNNYDTKFTKKVVSFSV